MNKIDFQDLNDNIITLMKSDQNFQISSKDTFYVYTDDLVKDIADVTDEENQLSNYLLSMIGTSKIDEEEILIVTTPINLHNLLVHFQRFIKSKQSPL